MLLVSVVSLVLMVVASERSLLGKLLSFVLLMTLFIGVRVVLVVQLKHLLRMQIVSLLRFIYQVLLRRLLLLESVLLAIELRIKADAHSIILLLLVTRITLFLQNYLLLFLLDFTL